MPRKLRIDEPAFYHVFSRGVEKRNVFLSKEDYEKFLSILDIVRIKFKLLIHSFCLMRNHYHILLETKSSNLSKTIAYLNSIYSIYFNHKYKRVGHLGKGSFFSSYMMNFKHLM